MAVWPSGARFIPLINSLQESPPNNLIRSSMDRGPDKVRRRTTANVREIAFNLFLSPEDVATLDTFYEDNTYSGANAFDYNHPRTGSSVQARFVETPSYQENDGIGYDVAIKLELLP